MKITPEYGQKIIVGVIHENTFRWYVTEKEIWYLDLPKLIAAYDRIGYPTNDPDDFSERFDIGIVNEDTATEFLHCIEPYRVETNELSNLLVHHQYEFIGEMAPALFIDFNKKLLLSEFPEPASFEAYVPD